MRGRSRRRSAVARAPATPVAGRMTANSSPPIRATVSISRELAREDLRECDERVVAGRVAVEIVDLLEVVDVDQQRSEGLAAAPGARQLVPEPLADGAAVEQAGQRIRGGGVAQLGDQAVDSLAQQPDHHGRAGGQARRSSASGSGRSGPGSMATNVAV